MNKYSDFQNILNILGVTKLLINNNSTKMPSATAFLTVRSIGNNSKNDCKVNGNNFPKLQEEDGSDYIYACRLLERFMTENERRSVPIEESDR